jgi:hypothetical protein
MTITSKLRKKVHRKAWEMCTQAPGSAQNGTFVDCISDTVFPDSVYYMTASASFYSYSPKEDAWQQLPASGAAGSFAVGSAGEAREIGMLGGTITNTPTAGTTNTLTTNKTIVRLLTGAEIRVVSGTGVGYIGTVSSNTIGVNSVITVTPANGVAFDTTTTFQIFSGSVWLFNGSTTAPGLSVYDKATNAWTAKSVTGIATSFGTIGQLISTGSKEGSMESGTASAGSSTTTLITGKTWGTNAWANYQLRIIAGTGAGQVRLVASNTSNILTISVAWTITPDATSTYSIEGNDDALYLLGNAAVTLYKYSISANTWTTITPTTARGGAMTSGGTAEWVSLIDACPPGTTNALGYGQPGRYIVSLRGGASSTMDIYDIAANTWFNAWGYGNQTETFSSGSSSVYDGHGSIYILKEGTGRIFKFDVAKNVIVPIATNPYPQSTTVTADLIWIDAYAETGGQLEFLYTLNHNRVELLRMLLV